MRLTNNLPLDFGQLGMVPLNEKCVLGASLYFTLTLLLIKFIQTNNASSSIMNIPHNNN